METETQEPNGSGPGEALNARSDAEGRCERGCNKNTAGWKTSYMVRVLLPLSVFLGILSFSLIVALTVVISRSHFPQLEFSGVCPNSQPGFQGNCYYFSEAEGNWTASRERCKALGASLAIISTRSELDFILRYKSESNHWLGLEKRDKGWWWINGTALKNRFEVQGRGPCVYLKPGNISSSLGHSKHAWMCSHPNDYILCFRELWQWTAGRRERPL